MQAVIRLGSETQASRLFSYPNLGHETESLGATINHYFSDSLAREGIVTANVTVQVSNIECTVYISGILDEQVPSVQGRYQAFFDNGILGLQDMDTFSATGKVDKLWQFLLPLGVPIANARAVELMDFPPLTLIQNQDYLKSKTTSRWWELLGLNGVSETQLALFSCILDIVPVAAPASAGLKLDASGIYGGPFDTYGMPQLELLSRTSDPNVRRPLIALGLPIRNWIQRIWGQQIDILNIGSLSLKGGGNCAVVASNHPSFFYYAVHSNTGPGSEQKNLAAGLAVMKQDIVTAAWHAEMGRNPAADPKAVMASSHANWQSKDAELLELVKKQAGIAELFALETSDQMLSTIQSLQPGSAQLADLERRFYVARNSGLLGDSR